ncbi:MAG: hypothetical protein II902_03650 [Selenomonadaceae bacterium]|nr:hypothetical protein [Selenomonadaceae bacterium]
MDMNLKTVRKEMTAGDLKGIIDLPNYADDQLVSVTVSSIAEQKPKKILSKEEIAEIWEKIHSAFKNVSEADRAKSLDDWRRERMEERYGIKFSD